jgi:GNAT superfamily N-acetyltransferase
MAKPPPPLEIQPLTKKRWKDLETLFSGPGGSQVRGCWCMYYRRSGSAPKPPGMTYAERNKCDLKTLVDKGVVPGLLGYRDGEPVAWVSLGPREDYRKLERSPVMKAVDDKPVWSVICFYTAKHVRGEGLSAQMLEGAAKYAREKGATLLEAYPVDKPQRTADENMWFGAKSMYDRAGYKEVARRKPARPIVRKALKPVRG